MLRSHCDHDTKNRDLVQEAVHLQRPVNKSNDSAYRRLSILSAPINSARMLIPAEGCPASVLIKSNATAIKKAVNLQHPISSTPMLLLAVYPNFPFRGERSVARNDSIHITT
jgi:hypothetical protein